MDKIVNELNRSMMATDDSIALCANRCIEIANGKEGILHLKELASHCKDRSDYVDFFKNTLNLSAEESTDGIVLRLKKSGCTCPICDKITFGKRKLCDCTRLHEIILWSAFFGKDVDVKILESFHRGGRDCVLEIVL